MILGGSVEMPELDYLRNLEVEIPTPEVARTSDCLYEYGDLTPFWLEAKEYLLSVGQSRFLRYTLRPEDEHLVDGSRLLR
eukprot:9827175-Lingulodinium_polyedra.AAC.1